MVDETKIVESPNSVEISISTKGVWSGKVKVYAPTSEEALEKAIKRAEELKLIIGGKNDEVQ